MNEEMVDRMNELMKNVDHDNCDVPRKYYHTKFPKRLIIVIEIGMPKCRNKMSKDEHYK